MYEKLILAAIDARKKAYVPYSNFCVGAAILTDNNIIYTGCNIENAAYSVCNCAERTALFKAVSEGITTFKGIAVVGGHSSEDVSNLKNYCTPCGVCRQALREFCNPEKFFIVVARSSNDYKKFWLSELLPESFGKSNLE